MLEKPDYLLVFFLSLILVVSLTAITPFTFADDDDEDDDDEKNPNLRVVNAIRALTETIENKETAVCPADKVQHWNKLGFFYQERSPGKVLVHDTLPDLPSGENPHEVIVQVPTDQAINIKQLVTDRLNELGYQRVLNDGRLVPVDPNEITIIDIEYSTICAEN